MTNLVDEFHKAAEEFKLAEDKYFKFVKEKLVNTLKPFFENHYQIESLSWHQGFSTYNDNTYDYHELSGYISIKWNKDKNTEEYFTLLDIVVDDSSEYFIDFDYGTNEDIDEILTKMKIQSEVDEIMKMIQLIPGTILVNLFGANSTVTVDKTGINTNTYYGEE